MAKKLAYNDEKTEMFKIADPHFFLPLQGAICFCEWEEKILMLKRSPNCSQGGLWTIAPGGKLEAGEKPLDAVIREVFEETGIRLDRQKIERKGSYRFQFDDLDYLLHVFFIRLSSFPSISLDGKEHTEFRWATIKEALKMPLMRGGAELLKDLFCKN